MVERDGDRIQLRYNKNKQIYFNKHVENSEMQRKVRREGLSDGKREVMQDKGSDCLREFMSECNSKMQRKVRRE